MNVMRAVAVGTSALLAAGVAVAQSGRMMGEGSVMDGGWMGGYGGFWVPVLLVAAAVGLVAWFLKQKGK